jgi:hypothetical protein
MDLWSIDRLTLFFLFFLPGFVSLKVYDLLVPGEMRDFSRAFFDALSYSALNFFVHLSTVEPAAMAQARQYFTQGHEVNFLDIQEWILMLLATMGRRGRDAFNRHLAGLVDAPDVPRSIKVAWNGQLTALVSIPSPQI